jgi:hypothetical protein
MVHDDPITTLSVPDTRPASPHRRVAAAQGVYFVLMGIWPLFGINSFQAVTGPKMDLWLVYTVGCLVAAIGASLLVAAFTGRTSLEIVVLAVASATALAGIDLVFVVRGVISWVYLLDALAEGGLVAWWVLSYVGPPKVAAARQYAHVQRLLNRGRSVSPMAARPGEPIG